MKVYVDEWGNGFDTGDDESASGPWRFNVVPVELHGPSEGSRTIEVTEEEYARFIAAKKDLAELQDLFWHRSEEAQGRVFE